MTTDAPPAPAQQPVQRGRGLAVIYAALMLAILLAALDQTIVSTALPTIVGDVVPPRERGRYQGAFGAVFGVASVAGPLLGGFFVDNIGWRWVFYINLPIGVVALAVIAAVLPATSARSRHAIDYAGTVLLGGAATCVVLLTSWGGTTYPWGSGVIIGLGAGAVAL